MSLTNDLEPKFLAALLNGLSKRVFFGDASMTNEFLVDNIFPASSLSADARLALIEDAERLIKSAGAENWDLARLAAEVKDMGLTQAQTEALGSFWKNERAKVNAQLVKTSRWNPQLVNSSWRIDVNSANKAGVTEEEPVAIMELILQANEDKNVVRFEMDRATVLNTVGEIEALQAQLAANQ